MSKQAKNKEMQGYEAKPIFPMCSNCKWFRSDKEINKWDYEEEKNIRCELPDLGGFAIKKMGTCKMHERMFNTKNEQKNRIKKRRVMKKYIVPNMKNRELGEGRRKCEICKKKFIGCPTFTGDKNDKQALMAATLMGNQHHLIDICDKCKKL